VVTEFAQNRVTLRIEIARHFAASLEMNKPFWTNALVIGLRILFGIAILAFGIYLRYRRLMRRSMRHDLLEKTNIQMLFGQDHSRDPYDNPEFNKLK
jgi:hypothetical protein